MCETTDKGYEMNDGTIIPFYGADIEHIKPEHIMELSQTPSSTWETFLIRNAMHKQGNEVQKIVNQTIADYPGKKLKKWSGVAGQLNVILTLINSIALVLIGIYVLTIGGG